MFKLDVKKNGKVVHQVGGSSREDCLAQLQPYFEHKTFGEPETTEQVLVSEEVRDEEGNVTQEAVYETLVTPADYEILISDCSEEAAQEAINSEALAYLSETDWMIIREAEGGTPCPPEVKVARAEARAKIIK